MRYHYFPRAGRRRQSASILTMMLNIPLVVTVFSINITQYYQYYSISLTEYFPIFLLLNRASKLCFSTGNSICANFHQYYKPFPIFINTPQIYLSNLEMSGSSADCCDSLNISRVPTG